jgi:hypothetical protein
LFEELQELQSNVDIHKRFGSKQDYVAAVKAASLERLARLIGVCGFLLQTKVYLFLMQLNAE